LGGGLTFSLFNNISLSDNISTRLLAVQKTNSLHLLHDLHNIFVVQDVLDADLLGQMLDRRAPNQSAESEKLKFRTKQTFAPESCHAKCNIDFTMGREFQN
jgi:hypothetical protein